MKKNQGYYVNANYFFWYIIKVLNQLKSINDLHNFKRIMMNKLWQQLARYAIRNNESHQHHIIHCKATNSGISLYNIIKLQCNDKEHPNPLIHDIKRFVSSKWVHISHGNIILYIMLKLLI